MVERVNGFCRLHCQRGSGTGEPNALLRSVLSAGGAGEAQEVTGRERSGSDVFLAKQSCLYHKFKLR